MRTDYYIQDVIKESELYAGTHVMFIVAEFPKINYVLAYRNSNFQPWVAAWDYHNGSRTWGQGHYFETIEGAMGHIQKLLDEERG